MMSGGHDFRLNVSAMESQVCVDGAPTRKCFFLGIGPVQDSPLSHSHCSKARAVERDEFVISNERRVATLGLGRLSGDRNEIWPMEKAGLISWASDSKRAYPKRPIARTPVWGVLLRTNSLTGSRRRCSKPQSLPFHETIVAYAPNGANNCLL